MKNRETFYFTNEEIETCNKLQIGRKQIKKLIQLGINMLLKAHENKNSH